MKKSPRQKRSRAVAHPRQAFHPQTFTFECTGDPKEIRKVEPFLQQINEAARLDDGTYYRLLVAGTEAVNNGILHGNYGCHHRLRGPYAFTQTTASSVMFSYIYYQIITFLEIIETSVLERNVF